MSCHINKEEYKPNYKNIILITKTYYVMKKIINISILILATSIFSGCVYMYDDENVDACASTRYAVYEVGEVINFHNCSLDAISYLWDFGDGYTSSSKYPEHFYSKPGIYEVKLSAFGHDDFDETYLTVEVVGVAYPTELNILVEFTGTTSPVRDCDVAIFEYYEDWYDLVNAVASGKTDNNGIIQFTDLKPIKYFIDAYLPVGENDFYSNENLGIETDPLVEGEINYYSIEVEFFQGDAGAKKRKRSSTKSVKLSPLTKPEFYAKVAKLSKN